MKNKKFFAAIVFLCCAVLVGWNIRNFRTHSPNKPLVDSRKVRQNQPAVSVVLNSGESIAIYDGILAANAFEALMIVSSKHAVPVETKQYDFGVFVEKIGGSANTKDKVWIYHVNGVSGDVAADKKILKMGDSVEWRYMKPTY
jgi:hypothetical protein